jgi:hypothetical protein
MKKKKRGNKGKKGKDLTTQAGLAIKNQFFTEAIWIISEILEKRLKNLLVKTDEQKPGAGFTLEQCIKRIKHLHVSDKSEVLRNFFDLKLIEKTMTWKNQRNTLVKDMLNVHVSMPRKEALAIDGVRLLKEWNKANKNFKMHQFSEIPMATEEIPPQ